MPLLILVLAALASPSGGSPAVDTVDYSRVIILYRRLNFTSSNISDNTIALVCKLGQYVEWLIWALKCALASRRCRVMRAKGGYLPLDNSRCECMTMRLIPINLQS